MAARPAIILRDRVAVTWAVGGGRRLRDRVAVTFAVVVCVIAQFEIT